MDLPRKLLAQPQSGDISQHNLLALPQSGDIPQLKMLVSGGIHY